MQKRKRIDHKAQSNEQKARADDKANPANEFYDRVKKRFHYDTP